MLLHQGTLLFFVNLCAIFVPVLFHFITVVLTEISHALSLTSRYLHSVQNYFVCLGSLVLCVKFQRVFLYFWKGWHATFHGNCIKIEVSLANVMVLVKTAPIGSYIWMLIHQGEELFDKYNKIRRYGLVGAAVILLQEVRH